MSVFSSRLEAVIFDLDGTLLDTAPEFIAAVRTLRAEHDLTPLPDAAVRAAVSDGARAMVALALNISRDDDAFESQRRRFLEIYASLLGSATTVYAGIVELLALLKEADIPWGISTNKPSYLTNPLIETMAFDPAPASIVCPDHVSRPKPDPEPLLLNCSQLACRPGATVCIGDHPRDIQAGKAAGMYTIAAAYGYVHPDEPIEEWDADGIARGGDELAGLLQAAFE